MRKIEMFELELDLIDNSKGFILTLGNFKIITMRISTFGLFVMQSNSFVLMIPSLVARDVTVNVAQSPCCVN